MILSKIIEIISGGTPKTDIKEYWNGSIPWISIKDFVNTNRYIENTEKSITELGLQKSATNLLKTNDIIISARGTVGKTALLRKEMAFNQSCYALRSKTKELNQLFLYYWLISNINKILASTHGAVFDTITKDDYYRIYINVPTLTTQKHIVHSIMHTL